MGENKLTIEHIGRRLPYGLIGEFELQKVINVPPSKEETRTKTLTLDNCKFFLDYCTPYLRPLSDLTKPITHKGETFIPDEKIREVIGSGWCDAYDDALDLIINQYSNHTKIKMLPYEFIELLISWHFVIDESEWIDVNTLENNCYK